MTRIDAAVRARATGRAPQVVPAVVILPRAEAQIIDVVSYTFEAFGETKYLEYG
jgi:hypothetical protein